MPNRILRDTTDSERITPLTERAELLFYRLIMKADDLGRFHANPERVRSFCFPFGRSHITEEICASCLKELEQAGLIVIYKRNSVEYLSIVSFKQRLRIIKPKFPEPVGKDSFWLPEFSKVPGGPPIDGHPTAACPTTGSQPSEKRTPETKGREEEDSSSSMYPGGTDLPIVINKGEESEKGNPPPVGDGGGDSPDKVPETAKPKAKPKAIPEKLPHDRRAVSDAWVLRFKQHTGSDYAFNGAKDGKAISDLLAVVPADKIIETIHSAFDTATQNHQGAFWLKKLSSLLMFTSRYNEIRHEITELSRTIPKNTMNQGVHLQASQREWSKQIKINLEEQRRKGIEMVEHLKAERLKASQQPPTPNEP